MLLILGGVIVLATIYLLVKQHETRRVLYYKLFNVRQTKRRCQSGSSVFHLSNRKPHLVEVEALRLD